MSNIEFDLSEESQATNQALASEIAALAPLTDAQLLQVLPEKIDRDKFAELQKIIQSDTNETEKITSLQSKFSSVGGVVVKLLGKLV